jgi:protein-tyrosine phosphatase
MVMRRVELPGAIPGQLYLHNMPGCGKPFADFSAAVAAKNVSRVVCMVSLDEISRNAPEYAKALRAGVPWQHITCPTPDFGVPDEAAFRALAQDIASRLRAGENIVIHCFAGIGRTGMMATAVLLALGEPLPQAYAIVAQAGSGAESESQEKLLAKIARNATDQR